MNCESLIYVGPSLEYIVQEGTVFRNGYPDTFRRVLSSYPFLQELIVPVKTLAEVKKSIRDPESNISMVYRKAEKIRRKNNYVI
jgi:hypothetical protein